MIRHNLYEIDLEKKTTFCTVCGPTEIYVVKRRTERMPKVFCLNRVRELRQTQKRCLDEKRRLNPGWKPRHTLSEIDTEKRIAVCTVCGPTEIRKRSDRGVIRYYCATRVRPYIRKYQRLHRPQRTLRPIVHRLSEIDEEKKTGVCSTCGPVDIYIWQGKKKFGRCCSNASVEDVIPAQRIRRGINTKLINEYKIKQGCKNCGYNKNAERLYLHSRHGNDPKIEKLLKLTRECLTKELEKSDILCRICRSLGHNEFEFDRHDSHIPVQFSHL